MRKMALVCEPAPTVVRGLRLKHSGDPDFRKADRQHFNYRDCLKSFGFELLVMPPHPLFPDSVFVEDPAIIIEDTLIISRLRTESRSGEEVEVLKKLCPFFRKIRYIRDPGFVEGGDVLVADKKLFIGLSGRTDACGAEQLAKIARDNCNFGSQIFEIPNHWLHLKGGVTYHRSKNVFTVTEEIASHFADSDAKLVVTPDDERFGANCISYNSVMLIHKGRAKTKTLLEQGGFRVIQIDLSEFEKIDGAMTCLSKLFLH